MTHEDEKIFRQTCDDIIHLAETGTRDAQLFALVKAVLFLCVVIQAKGESFT